MDKTVIETVVEAAVDWRIEDIKGLLGRCNFKADILDRKVSLLSGGEKVTLYFIPFPIILFPCIVSFFGVLHCHLFSCSVIGTSCFLQIHGETIHSTCVGRTHQSLRHTFKRNA